MRNTDKKKAKCPPLDTTSPSLCTWVEPKGSRKTRMLSTRDASYLLNDTKDSSSLPSPPYPGFFSKGDRCQMRDDGKLVFYR